MWRKFRNHPAYLYLLIVFLLSILLLFIRSFPQQALEEKGGQAKSADLSTAIIQVAKQNIPAVVHIEVTERREMASPFAPFESDPFFRRFFNVPEQQKKFKREVKGLGTGMIIDTEGHILTNHHVAGGATKLEVLLSDGQNYPAKLIGTDPKTDLAVIKISAKGSLSHVTFGDSDKVEVGEWVVAIGHPRGLDQTVTQGIISAKHRHGITDPDTYQDFLQTDAAINPGNSGGPLLNLQGEVIGVNAVIVSESGGFEGIGFTIPSNMALKVAKSLIAHGKVRRGWLGVSIQDITPALAESLKVEITRGSLIAEVAKGGPAEKGGLKKNDVVIAYQDKEVANSSMMRNEVAATPVGQEVKITILREGKRQDLVLKVEDLESATRILAGNVKDRQGIEVRPLAAKEVQRYNLDNNQGVAVSWINPKGPFGKAGFEVDDIILGIENQPIENPERFVNVLSSVNPGQNVTISAIDHRTGSVGNVQIEVR